MTRPRPHLERHMPREVTSLQIHFPGFSCSLLVFSLQDSNPHVVSHSGMCDQYHFDQWGQEQEDAEVRWTRGEREYLFPHTYLLNKLQEMSKGSAFNRSATPLKWILDRRLGITLSHVLVSLPSFFGSSQGGVGKEYLGGFGGLWTMLPSLAFKCITLAIKNKWKTKTNKQQKERFLQVRLAWLLSPQAGHRECLWSARKNPHCQLN